MRSLIGRRGLVVVLNVALAAQDKPDPIDLLTINPPVLPLYVPRWPDARIDVITDDAAATKYAVAAFGENKSELHVDFANLQVLAVCWGERILDADFRGGCPEVSLEKAVVEVDVDVLRITVRTHLPLGARSEPAAGDGATRTWQPSVFLCAPKTARVVVDVVGARPRAGTAKDFVQVNTPALVVRVAPDSAPSRREVELVAPAGPSPEEPAILAEHRAGGWRLAVHWGEHPGDGIYRLCVDELLIKGGVARLTVRAERVSVFFYSGPPELRPSLSLELPAVDRIALHIVRRGSLTPGDQHDFTDQHAEGLDVDVDRSALASTKSQPAALRRR
ncbi:MAG TPA: hypothetical protein VFZ65_23350 [Planctomycetota bacterium]|nr:hypothetical protein [Planctomycetota bacterium]